MSGSAVFLFWEGRREDSVALVAFIFLLFFLEGVHKVAEAFGQGLLGKSVESFAHGLSHNVSLLGRLSFAGDRSFAFSVLHHTGSQFLRGRGPNLDPDPQPDVAL
ncbi:hypothetical protein HY29_10890 [Hyphomonas beringensis]|uniref:Uncharacterized protein n=1 Tax=Hyphomonas beringensis TaxID=1280946 RepID=A0A062UD44_9PROT|nr:hypothetical protein HY29_10890 [Hyphomonas beringensis]